MTHTGLPDTAAERELAAWKRKYEFLFSNMLTGYAYHRVVTDDAGRPNDYVFLEVNDQFERLTGLRRDDLIGRRVTEVLPGIEHAEFDWIGAYGTVALGGERIHFDQYSEQLDRWYSVTAYCPERGTFVTVFHDVTERKRTEQALRDKEEQLLHAQKMEAMGRLAGGVAHDFNNLLTAILGFGGVLQRAVPDDRLKRCATQVVRAAERGAALTAQLLAFGRRQVLSPQTLEPARLLNELEDILQRLVREDRRLELAVSDETPPVRADRGQLEQVVMNLVVNAVDASVAGGRVRVRLAPVDLAEPRTVRGGELPPGRWCMVEVSDDGEGIPADVLDRIFEPFFTTKALGQGTGLGLAMVAGVVEQSGGYLDVTTAVGEGTTMRVYLPAAVDVGPAAVRRPPLAASHEGTEHVLVVDAAAAVLAATEVGLRDAGYRVTGCLSGEDALALARDASASIDVVVSDAVLRDTDGLSLLDAIQGHQPRIARLLISGYMDADILERVEVTDGLSFLQKPFTTADLGRAIRSALD